MDVERRNVGRRRGWATLAVACLVASCTIAIDREVETSVAARGVHGLVYATAADGTRGEPLAGVVVRAGTRETRTGPDGSWSLQVTASTVTAPVTLQFQRRGFGPYTQWLRALPDDGLHLTTYLRPVDVVRRVRVDAGAVIAGDVDGDGRTDATLSLPANFVTTDGEELEVALTVVRPEVAAELRQFPGTYRGREASSTEATDVLRTFGTVNVAFRDADGELIEEVALQEPAKMQLVLDPAIAADVAVGDEIPTWWFDEARGDWVREGGATVIMQNGTKMAEWYVEHFTWWNVDEPLDQHACAAVQLTGAGGARATRFDGLQLLLSGADYAGDSEPQLFDADGLAVATGWRGRSVRLTLAFGADAFAGLRLPLVPADASEGDVTASTFDLPATIGSTVYGEGPGGVPLVPQEHCLYLERTVDLKQGTIEGFVVDHRGQPITDTVVSIAELGTSAEPNPAGHVAFSRVPWSRSLDVRLTLQASTPPSRPDLRFDDIVLQRDAAHDRVQLVAVPYPRRPYVVAQTLSNSSPAVGQPVTVMVSVADDAANLSWELSASAGEVTDVDVWTRDVGDLHEADVHATWYPPTQPGRHTVDVVVRDVDGNRSIATLAATWRNAPPVVSLQGPTYVAVGDTATIVVDAIDPDGDALDWTWRVDGGAVAVPPTQDWLDVDVVAERPTLVQVSVSDGRNVVDQVHTLIVGDGNGDGGTGPDTRILEGPPLAQRGGSATFRFRSPNTDVVGFECMVDAPPPVECTSPWTVAGLGAGAHTFLVRAVDAAGRRDGSPAFQTWFVDHTPPETAILDGPADPSDDAEVNVNFLGSDDVAVDRYECRQNGRDWGTCASPHAIYAYPGDNVFDVRAVDVAGNVDPTPANWTWTAEIDGGVWPLVGRTPQNVMRTAAPELSAVDGVGWSFPVLGQNHAAAVVARDGTIYVGDGDRYCGAACLDDAFVYDYGGSLYAVAADGTQRWSAPLDGEAAVGAPAVGPGGDVYVAAGGEDVLSGLAMGAIYAYRPSGQRLWRHELATCPRSSPLVAYDGRIFMATTGGELLALDEDGNVLWSQEEALDGLGTSYCAEALGLHMALSPDGDTLYVLDRYALRAVDAGDGAERWSYDVTWYGNYYYYYSDGNMARPPVVDAAGAIYVVDRYGTLHAIAADGTARWQESLHPDPYSYYYYYYYGMPPSVAIATDGAVMALIESDWPEGGAPRGGLFAFDASGALRWQYVMPVAEGSRALLASPLVLDASGTSYFLTQGYYDLAMNYVHDAVAIAADGTVRWQAGVPDFEYGELSVGRNGALLYTTPEALYQFE